MQLAFAHLLMLAFGGGASRYGWFMVHNPERALRFFTFGTEPTFGKRFFLSWNRAAGWFFTGFGCLAVAASLVLLAVDLFTMVENAGK
jgi:hypothetical protein